jgi:hypothetical protein
MTRWRSDSGRGQYSDQLQPIQSGVSTQSVGDSLSQARSIEQPREVEIEMASGTGAAGAAAASSHNTDAGVDRHSSVRSIMTLPPYSSAARPEEQVLGREGERAGIDVVVEHPETIDEEEVRRDGEMDSLYQIRRARRAEAADREERRRLRREARARGDQATLARLQEESRARATAASDGTLLSTQLIAEHQTKNRERRVSSVQYADIGLARHDGSRIRGTSIDSDNRPLLSSAAPLGSSSTQMDSAAPSMHGRGRSSTSVHSMSSLGSSEGGAMDGGRDDFEVISLDNRSRASSISPSFSMPQEETSSNASPPPIHPPQYDDLAAGWGDAPPYESPVADRAPQPLMNLPPQLPQLAHVPSIEITPHSPINSPNPQQHPTS